MLNVTFFGDRELVARFRGMPSALRAALIRKTNVLSLMLEARVKQKLNGQVLNVVTGALRRSIQREVIATATSIKGKVFSAGDVKYAGIHEFGGKTPAHVIYPNKAKALAFWSGAAGGMYGVGKVFAAKVNHPGSVMPERSYMRSSLREMEGTIRQGYRDTVVATAGGKAN